MDFEKDALSVVHSIFFSLVECRSLQKNRKVSRHIHTAPLVFNLSIVLAGWLTLKGREEQDIN